MGWESGSGCVQILSNKLIYHPVNPLLKGGNDRFKSKIYEHINAYHMKATFCCKMDGVVGGGGWEGNHRISETKGQYLGQYGLMVDELLSIHRI